MSIEQQINQAVEYWKCVLCQPDRTAEENKNISDQLDAIGHQLKAAEAFRVGNFTKAFFENKISKLYQEQSKHR